MKTKEQWIDETIASLDDMVRAESEPGLYDKVMDRMNGNREIKRFYTPYLVWKVAAGIVLLISVNLFSMLWHSRSDQTSQSKTEVLDTEYFSYIETIKF